MPDNNDELVIIALKLILAKNNDPFKTKAYISECLDELITILERNLLEKRKNG